MLFFTKINGAFSNYQIATVGISKDSGIAFFLFNVFTGDLLLKEYSTRFICE